MKVLSVVFFEEVNFIREGVVLYKEDKKFKEVLVGVCWIKISRRKVNFEVFEIGKERFEVCDDFVIVFRVFSVEDI